MKRLFAAAMAALTLGFMTPQEAKADKLQDIIAKGTIRIGLGWRRCQQRRLCSEKARGIYHAPWR